MDSSPCTASTPIPSNQEAFPSPEETASTASSDSGKQPRLSNNPKKRKRVSEDAVELQKLDLLKQMVAQMDSQTPRDTFTFFGNQVALELRDIQDPVLLSRVKRSIMIMIYNAQENDRSGSLSSPGQPTPYQPVNTGLPTARLIPSSLIMPQVMGFIDHFWRHNPNMPMTRHSNEPVNNCGFLLF